MTSAPSVTDIGFSGMRSAKSTSADQPVASAIGISGTSARCQRAEGDEQHERDRGQAGEQRDAAAATATTRRALASAASTGRPGQVGAHARPAGAGGRASSSMHLLLAVERHQADAEGERRGAPVGA